MTISFKSLMKKEHFAAKNDSKGGKLDSMKISKIFSKTDNFFCVNSTI